MYERVCRAVRLAAVACALLSVTDAGAHAVQRVTIVVVPGLKSGDISPGRSSTLQGLAARGWVGWMNTRTARVGRGVRDTARSSLLTMGSGARAYCPESVWDSGDRAWLEVRAANSALDHEVSLGALGDLAHRAGARTLTIGDEDDSRPRRPAWLMACDSRGRVDRDLGRGSRIDLAAPYGLAADPLLYTAAARSSEELQIWYFGDMARCQSYAPRCLPHVARAQRASARLRLDEVLRLAVARPVSALIVLSPLPGIDSSRVDRLVPVIVAPMDGSVGWITSPSTRVRGLITSTDIVPTVAMLLGAVVPAGAVGRSARVQPDLAARRQWAEPRARWLRQAEAQSYTGGVPMVQAALVFVLAASLLGRMGRRSDWSARAAAAVLTALPLAHLALPLIFPDMGPGVAAVALLLAMAACCALSPIGRRTATATACAATGAYAVLVIADLALGGHLVRRSWLGYSVMEGARFYGVGNETAGAALACLLVALAFLTATVGHIGRVIAMAFAAGVMGWPSLGANAGAAMSAAACAVVLAGAKSSRTVRWPVVLMAGAAVGVAGVALSIGDLFLTGGAHSHMGRAFESTSGLWSIALRKLAMNAHLLLHSPWALCLLAILFLPWRRWASDDRMGWAVPAAAALAGALLLLNDSGVVAAAQALTVLGGGLALVSRQSATAAEPAQTE